MSAPDSSQTILELIKQASNAKDLASLWASLQLGAQQIINADLSLHLREEFLGWDEGNPGLNPHLQAFHLATEKNRRTTLNYLAGQKSFLAGIPLEANGRPIGSLVFHRPKVDFTEADTRTMEQFASLAVITLQSLQGLQAQHFQQKQIELIAQVTSELAHITDLNILSQELCRLIQEKFGYYYVAFFTLEPGSNRLSFRASAGQQDAGMPLYDSQDTSSLLLGEHIIGSVAKTGRAILANDVTKEPKYYASEALPETQSELAIPVKIGKEVVGVLDVESDRKQAFDNNDVMVLTSLAESIGFAIHRVRLVSEVQEQNEQLELIAQVSQSINSILDLESLLQHVTDLIHQEFNFPYVNIFLIHHPTKTIEFKAGSGSDSAAFRDEGQFFDLYAPKGIIPLAARSGEVQWVKDADADPFYLPNPITKKETGSELAIPLMFGTTVFGVLDVESDAPNAFTASDVQLLKTLSDNIAIALRNANLYHSETWRRRVAENLRDVALLLSEQIDLTQLVKVILSKVQELLPCDLACLWLLDEDEEGQMLQPEKLTLFAARSSNKDFPHPQALATEDAWYFQAIHQEVPVIHNPSMTEDPLAFYEKMPANYSAIAAPLTIGGETLGVLTLHHHTPGRYGPEATNISASFAGYTANAIQNSRLTLESRDQAWISTILLQVALMTQSITNISELTEMIGELVLLLIGGVAGGIFVLNETKTQFSLLSFFGEVSESAKDVLPLKVVPAEPLWEAANSRTAIAIPLKQCMSQVSDLLDLPPESTILLFPLIAHDENIGTLMHISREPYIPRKPEQVMGGQKLAILHGIAQQTAVSLQNIGLMEDRQEESYISYQLLQNSNLIVALNDLDQSLERICHSLPVITGVEAAAILLLSEDGSHFTLAHLASTSLPSWQREDSIGRTFTTEELPLLQEFSRQKKYLVKPAEVFDSLVYDPNQTTSPTDETDLPLGVDDQSSTLCFPAMVREQDYGLILVKDPGHSKRERRIELLSGISEQIALAIQNHRFVAAKEHQADVEREFHFARQIQRNFLPERLPAIPGYELEVKWQTARQVGGDFYDAFTIGEDSIGLVIADVSDKGLAAALYMTVCRTLIRTIALESDSPAHTLEKVNQLLQLDTTNGFFVTVFYGILHPGTGAFTYCNAGHNPPYLLKPSEKSLTPLQRGGVALGAIEDITLPQHEIMLDPGDGVVMFTDGVTETVNQDGDFFGTERYEKTLQKVLEKSPREVIEAVQQSLGKFRGRGMLSDDVTQLVLRRES